MRKQLDPKLGSNFVFFPQILLSTLSLISEKLIVTRDCGQHEGECGVLAVVAIATCLPQNRSNMVEQTEKCLRRLETHKEQR